MNMLIQRREKKVFFFNVTDATNSAFRRFWWFAATIEAFASIFLSAENPSTHKYLDQTDCGRGFSAKR